MLEFHKAKRPPVTFKGVFWALFGNEDDGYYGDDTWRAGRPKTLVLGVKWWLRNPAHNWCFYVIGFADYDHYFEGEKDWGVDPGFSFHWCYREGKTKFPLLSYVGKKRGWYIGWRPYGSFGISLNFASKD